nr:HAMP domain-containing sensor histidine kinase [Candidatus Wallbacteria bacterium]
ENINLLEQSNSMLKSTQNELIQKEKLVSLGQMAAGVAHEINNPLGTVLLYAHMLNEQIENEDMKSDVKTIITEINRTKEIITGMLNFSRENKLTISEFDFSKFIKEICEKVQYDFSAVGINIVIKVNCPDNVSIDADQTALAQVFSNLLSNAKDAIMEAKRDIGKIKVEVIKYDEELSILFTDNGTGIPKDKIAKLFTPFFTTKGYGKGTGLGLPVVYGIIKMHRGKIMVDSIEGESTTFKINLPLKSNVSAGLLG